MGFQRDWTVAVLLTSFIFMPAVAVAETPDRSTLSYDENVTINAACY
jgi:hypothetical protein